MHSQAQGRWLDMLAHEAHTLTAELGRHSVVRRLCEGSIDAADYASFLMKTWHCVRWTTPLLERAGQRMKQLGAHPELAGVLLQEAAEERGHQQLLLADLKNLGWPAEQLERTEPSPAVAVSMAWNEFTLAASLLTSFLGTAYVFEHLAAHWARTAVERLLAREAIPNIREALSFLQAHEDVDAGQLEQLRSALRSVTAPDEQSAVVLAARTARALYRGIFHQPAPGERPITSA